MKNILRVFQKNLALVLTIQNTQFINILFALLYMWKSVLNLVC
jgi:hypothetical protein